MVIVKESLAGRDQLRLQDLFRKPRMSKRLSPSFATQVNQNPRADSCARGEFRRYLSHGKRRKKVKWPKARLDREER